MTIGRIVSILFISLSIYFVIRDKKIISRSGKGEE